MFLGCLSAKKTADEIKPETNKRFCSDWVQ
jgi:hypothetical protein